MFAATVATTTYKYTNPHWAPEGDTPDAHTYAFRGFEEVESTAPSGAVTIERFSYSPDWSGRLATKIVKPSAASVTSTVDDTTWEARTLFGGNITTYHATASDHWTCKNGQDESSCRANTDTRTHTETTWTALSSTSTMNTAPLLWEATLTRLGAGPTLADGDRETSTTYALYADEATYRLHSLVTTKSRLASGNSQTYGKSAATWDSSNRVQLTDETWVDSDDIHRAIARSVYDMTTGNVIERWKPEQNAANTVKTTLTYDARKLFVATETNELGHVRDYTWDYGTGVKLRTDGPNVRSCVPGPTCPSTDGYPVKEQEKIVVDALGRTLERWTVFGDNGSIYYLTQVETNQYTEATTTAPAAITHHLRVNALDGLTPQWTEDKTELDGHGRPLRSIQRALGTAPADAITSYQYANDGTLIGVTVPDPTANDASVVMYSYAYDSLGRPTSIRRPDDTNPSQRSGVNITYDGLTQTTTEVVKANDGAVASTKTFNDTFGRLVRVDEQSGASTWQSTLYSYTPDDLVTTVTDAQGVKTSLGHDWAGHRVRITRPGGSGLGLSICQARVGTGTCRDWKYTYDRNGNEIAEQVPGSPNAAADINYTNTTVYDALDRPVSKVLGPRALSTADQTLFGSNTEAFGWDGAGNGKGRLRSWVSYGPGSSWVASHTFWVNSQQKPYSTTVQFRGADYSTLTRDAVEEWYMHGQRQAIRHREFVGPNRSETWTITRVDALGRPNLLSVVNRAEQTGAATFYTVGEQTRNVAGLVTKRRNNVPTSMGVPSPGRFVESNWTYDKLGRVVDQTVQQGVTGGTATPVARQQLQYFGNDDPKTLTHSLGSTSHAFTFGYDQRHQLTSAVADDASYFSSSYAYGNAGRLDAATIEQTMSPSPDGSELKSRDVTYVYGGQDPEQVTALVQASGPNQGATLAAYTYDAAGNQITRSYPATGESWDYTYDGKDQLRRAVKKLNGNVQGSEEYWYANDGARTQVVKRDASGTKTELIWYLKDTEFHYDGAGTLTKTYAHASLGTPVARIERSVANGDTPTFEYQFHGLASNTLAAVAPDGTINASFSYTPFGEVLEATNGGGTSGGAAAHKRRFNDEVEDDLTGLKYYGFRYYDALSMTWTQSDPLYRFVPDAASADPRRAILYMFSLSNPLRYVDPDGRDSSLSIANIKSADDLANEAAALRQSIEKAENIGSLIYDLFHGTGGVKATYVSRVNSTQGRPLTREEAETLAGIVYAALNMSDSLRAMFGDLMANGRHTVFLALTGRGDTITRPRAGNDDLGANNGLGVDSIIYYNPGDGQSVSVGGNKVLSDPFSKLAHEVFHADQQVRGRQSTNQSTREQQATAFENVFRAEAARSDFSAGQRLGQRDCWGPHPCGERGPVRTSGHQ